MFLSSDDKYSSGTDITWMGKEFSQTEKESFNYHYVSAISSVISLLPFVDLHNKKRNASISLEQIIITPDDIKSTEPIYTDIPYTGVLNGNFSLYLWEDSMFQEFRFSIGVVGPLSGAQQAQSVIHKLIGNSVPKGWDNQLGDKLLFGVDYLQGFRNYEHQFFNATSLEWFNNYSINLGNSYLGAGVSTIVRYGHNVPRNFITTDSLLDSSRSHQLNFSSRSKDFGWSVSLGFSLDVLGYSYINSESKRLGYLYSEDQLLFSRKIGGDLYLDNFQLSFEIFPLGEVVVKNGITSDSWGRIKLTWYLE
jgi:hypothetical protein